MVATGYGRGDHTTATAASDIDDDDGMVHNGSGGGILFWLND